jgi:tripartite-type tricarboxylate transporter receptor subunit TctC
MNFPPVKMSVLALALAVAGTAGAAAYPDKPIRMLVGFAAGGGTDTTARTIGIPMAEALGQQVIVDNRPGAAGNIAADITAHAVPDGYTILMGTIAALAINPSLYQKLPFDPIKDFEPISLVVSSMNVLVVHPSVAAKNVKELIALAKAQPNKLSYGSSGVGGAGHLAGVLFDQLAGTTMTHVPYKGGAPARNALVGGEVNVVFATAETAVPQIKANKIRALGVTTAKRSALLPELPTIAEGGLAGYEANNWYGLVAPAKTPAAIIERLNREVVKALNKPTVKEQLFRSGLDASPSTPKEFSAYIKSEMAKWSKVVKASGAKAE